MVLPFYNQLFEFFYLPLNWYFPIFKQSSNLLALYFTQMLQEVLLYLLLLLNVVTQSKQEG